MLSSDSRRNVLRKRRDFPIVMRKVPRMKRFYGFLLLAAIIVVGLGFYRGWFTLSGGRESQSNKVDVNLSVDPDRIRQDAETLKDKTRGSD